jgi:3-amino-5-hydroxybenzoic acid synthesis related protein
LKKGVVFDFDGVIINSFEVQKRALKESYNIVVGVGEPSVEEFFSYSGDSLENIFRKMNLPLDMVKFYNEISRQQLDCIYIYDGMRELLQNLREQGYNCGLCTGKNRKRTIEILKKLDLEMFFDTIICSDDVRRPKPHPDSLELVLKNIGITKESVVMIGDAPNDIICAKSIDVKVIGVSWGEIKKEILVQEHPDYIVDTVDELFDRLKYLLR